MDHILVIGSVHADILAEIDPRTKENIDKIGRLTYSIGGTAFNVAANLAHHRTGVKLASVIRSDSLLSNAIDLELRRRALSPALITKAPMPTESGFVAHSLDGIMTTAVSCIGIQDTTLDERLISHAIRKASLVALECNLARSQIQLVTRLAAEANKPVCACAVSESKVDRLCRLSSAPARSTFAFVIMNRLELEKISREFGASTPADLRRLCSTDHLVVTAGVDGFYVLGPDDSRSDFRTDFGTIVSTLGAGDALFAALCDHFLRNGTLHRTSVETDAKRFLGPVLQSGGAVPQPPEEPRYALQLVAELAPSLVALPALLLAAAGVAYGLFWPEVSRPAVGALLFVVSAFSGVVGSQIERLLLRQSRDPFARESEEALVHGVTRGTVAGLVAGLLFFLPQIIGDGGLQAGGTQDISQLRLLLPFCMLVGLIGGLAADSLFKRLKDVQLKVDVVSKLGQGGS